MPIPVEQFGGLGVGVVIEETVEHGEGGGVGLPGVPARQRERDRECGGGPAAEADIEQDLV